MTVTNPMKYISDWRTDPADDSTYVSSIQAEMPHLSVQAVEVNSTAAPTIPLGRCRVTVLLPWTTDSDKTSSMAIHGEIMQVPGVELFSGDMGAS